MSLQASLKLGPVTHAVLDCMTLRFLEMLGDTAFLALFGASARTAFPI